MIAHLSCGSLVAEMPSWATAWPCDPEQSKFYTLTHHRREETEAEAQPGATAESISDILCAGEELSKYETNRPTEYDFEDDNHPGHISDQRISGRELFESAIASDNTALLPRLPQLLKSLQSIDSKMEHMSCRKVSIATAEDHTEER